MRHGNAGRRSRNNNNGNGGGHRGHNNRGNGGGHGRAPNRMQVFDSNGPEVRIRGTAHQIVEKYQTLAKDANAMGDRVLAESYLQHAEHYQRIISSWNDYAPVVNEAQSVDAVDLSAQPQPSIQPRHQPQKAQEADLGLPSSIVGARVDVGSEMADA